MNPDKEYQQMKESLQHGLTQLQLTMSVDAQDKLLNYALLLQKWNKTYNLTAVRTLPEILTRHLLDSLTIAPFIHGEEILDVGTGAGLPGIPLALLYPERKFTLLDSNGKKIRFLTQTLAELKINNVIAVQARIEQFVSPQCFDNIVVRAFGSLKDILQCCLHLGCKNGRILLMKGTYPTVELAELNQPAKVHRLNVPGLQEERHLVCIDLV